jgi:hypothetical protein
MIACAGNGSATGTLSATTAQTASPLRQAARDARASPTRISACVGGRAGDAGDTGPPGA